MYRVHFDKVWPILGFFCQFCTGSHPCSCPEKKALNWPKTHFLGGACRGRWAGGGGGYCLTLASIHIWWSPDLIHIVGE